MIDRIPDKLETILMSLILAREGVEFFYLNEEPAHFFGCKVTHMDSGRVREGSGYMPLDALLDATKSTIKEGVAIQEAPINQILQGDCREVLKAYPDNFFSACITDPPYNYEFIGRNWNEEEIDRRTERVQNSKTLVKNIPYGSGLAGGVRNKRWYEKNRANIVDYQSWCLEWSRELFRTVKPGAYVMVFNSTRTIAHVQVALEDAGFYARDIIVWKRHAGIPKGINMAEKLKKMGEENAESWKGWHSCLRNEWEAICLVQKPLLNNYIETLQTNGLGLMHAEMMGNGFLSNVIEGFKKSDSEKFDDHCTVKPLDLITYLTKLVIPKDRSHIILDPFVGSGTTCVAAKNLGVNYVGIDVSAKYCELAKKRLGDDVQLGLF